MAAMPSMTRKTKSARADRQAEIEQRMRTAIASLVAEGESFTELSVERLVAEAGMARSTFYVYFADKGTLLQALGATSLHRLYEGASPWLQKKDAVTRDDVVAAMQAILRSFREDEVILTAVAETAVYDPDVREMYRRSVDGFVGAVRKLIVRGQKAGTVRDVRAAETAAALSWMIERTTLQLTPGASDKELEGIAEGMGDVVWGALYGV